MASAPARVHVATALLRLYAMSAPLLRDTSIRLSGVSIANLHSRLGSSPLSLKLRCANSSARQRRRGPCLADKARSNQRLVAHSRMATEIANKARAKHLDVVQIRRIVIQIFIVSKLRFGHRAKRTFEFFRSRF